MKYNLTSEYEAYPEGIVIAGHFHEDDSYLTKRPLGMKDWLITYTLSGEGYFLTGDQHQSCRSGEVTLLKPNTPHQYGTKPGQTWNFIWAHFSPHLPETDLLPNEPVYIQAIENAYTRKRIYRAFKNILSDSRERKEYWHQLCLNTLREILMLIVQGNKEKLDPRIEEVLHLLSKQMKEPVRLNDLARTVGLSPSRLSHLFKACTGQSIVDATNQMRIRQAALLLEHTNRSLSEICHDVGFYNYNHFINQFRKWYGMNPSTFKKQICEK